ncbi:MAG: glycosyltransferase family 4 protein [Phycisphaerales bacterium]|nr:glycosyltransferase family 4 protein [Phycisphaerales bacterium]
MKIAHVITRLIIGGAQENTVLTCAGLRDGGHDVTLIAGPETGPEGSLWPQADASSTHTIKLDSMRRSVKPLLDYKCAGELAAIFRREKFDIIHTHSSKAGIVARYAAHKAGGAKVVHTIHGMSFNRTQSKLTQRVFAYLERRAARWTDAIISVADAMTEQSIAARIAPRDRFTTIRSGIETTLFEPNAQTRAEVRKRWGVADGAVVVGTVARLFENKGYEHILKAMPAIARACPHVRFVWIGDGAHRGQYEAELARLGLSDQVVFTGLVSPDEVARLMNGMDVLVHASMWEGLPRVLVQASLMKVPCVSFDNDGAPEAIDDGVTGWLVPLGDCTKLGERVAQLCNDAKLRASMGEGARAHCVERFDVQKMVDDIANLYQKLVANPAR